MYRVLVLSEEKVLFEKIVNMIGQQEEIEISTCPDSLDLLEKFFSLYTELVVLDLDLLNNQIMKLINILHSFKKNLKIILILSEEKMSICPSVCSLGVVSYLIKPFSLKNAADIISSALKIQNTK